jgi:hypothetical protein
MHHNMIERGASHWEIMVRFAMNLSKGIALWPYYYGISCSHRDIDISGSRGSFAKYVAKTLRLMARMHRTTRGATITRVTSIASRIRFLEEKREKKKELQT